VILIYISLITKDVGHLFIHHLHVFMECPFSPSAHFLLSVFLLLICRRSSIYSEYRPFLDICLENIFSPSMSHPLTFLRVSFEQQKILILIKSNLLIFSIMLTMFVFSPRNHCLPQKCKNIFLYFLLKAL